MAGISQSIGAIPQVAATMPETLQSTAAMTETLRSTGVIPPEGFLPDDTVLHYKNGILSGERDYNDPDYDDENVFDEEEYDRCVALALEYYNGKHHTDYQPVPSFTLQGGTWMDKQGAFEIHCGFAAVRVGAQCDTAAKYFCSKLLQSKCDGGFEEAVISCVIVDGINPTDCWSCNERHKLGFISLSPMVDEIQKRQALEDALPYPSEYADDVADGVTLRDKAKIRHKYTLLALAYYNKKHHTDYKIVDVLPYCVRPVNGLVVHCNFIARRNAGADASNELFFAELEKREPVVTFVRDMEGGGSFIPLGDIVMGFTLVIASLIL